MAMPIAADTNANNTLGNIKIASSNGLSASVAWERGSSMEAAFPARHGCLDLISLLAQS